MRLFVFGLGYSARAVVRRLAPQLEKAWGTTRSGDSREDMAALGVEPIVFEGHASPLPAPPSGESGVAAALSQATHLLVSIPPDESGDPVLNAFRPEIIAAKPQSVVYLSTVGVYGDHGGAWVDETSECRPVSERSRQRLAAEQAWRSFADESGFPVAILRLAGIYGPGRGPFEKIRQGTARRIVKPGQVFNRIHVEDIANVLAAAIARPTKHSVYNVTDDEPAPSQDVLAYAAAQLGLPAPPLIDFATADLTPMARSFYSECKRISNARIKSALGVTLLFPTYRDGMKRDAALLRS